MCSYNQEGFRALREKNSVEADEDFAVYWDDREYYSCMPATYAIGKVSWMVSVVLLCVQYIIIVCVTILYDICITISCILVCECYVKVCMSWLTCRISWCFIKPLVVIASISEIGAVAGSFSWNLRSVQFYQ